MTSTGRRRGRSPSATGTRARCTSGGRGVRWRRRGPCCSRNWWTIRRGGRNCFPTEAEQDRERERLFGILRKLVLWENTTKRGGARSGAGGDPGVLAAGVCGQRGPPAGGGTLRPGEAAGVPRPVRRGRGDPVGGAAAWARGARERPEPGGGAHQQGDDRDSAPARGPASGEPGGAGAEDGGRPGVARGGGARGGRALLREVDAGTRRRSGSATCTQRRGSRRRWWRSGQTWSAT